MSSNY